MMRPRITIHKGIRMLVAVDIGNTNIVLGFLDGDDIIGTYRITTKSNHTSDEYGLMITQFLALSGLRPSDIDDVIIASVVPKVMHSFRASIIKFLNINPMVVGPGIKTGINIRIDDPKSLGSDCLADCVGAYYTYGGPVLVADFGTATTFDVVGDDGAYVGGVISPGVNLSLDALHMGAASLPHVDISRPAQVIGTNTVECIQSGVFWGYAGLVREICARIAAERGRPMKVIATGGLAALFDQIEDLFDRWDDDLTMHGLRLIHDYNKEMGNV